MARRPLVVHDFDDELEMTRFCEALWPGPKIKKLREAVEAEYAARPELSGTTAVFT
jgi:hypothetical protein